MQGDISPIDDAVSNHLSTVLSRTPIAGYELRCQQRKAAERETEEEGQEKDQL